MKQAGPPRAPWGACPVPAAGGAGAAEEDAPSLLQHGFTALAVAVASLLFFLAARALGPDSLALPLFNSDTAIPVLMGNETHLTLFHAYYLGEDRFGAWPFLLAHLVASALHTEVTPWGLHGLAMAFLALGAVPAMLLLPGRAGLAALAYLVALLVPETRAFLFDSQPYTWQVPLLLWAWWASRRAWTADTASARRLWLGLLTLLCVLATWTSALSGPLLLGLLCLEGAGQGARTGLRPPVRLVLQLFPAVVGMLAEALLRGAYHRYVRGTFHRDFRTLMHLDTGHLLANVAQVVSRLATPFAFSLLLVLTLGVGLGVQRRRHRPWADWRLGPLASTVAGAFLLAVLPLPALALLAHVRLNEYAPRYFTPSAFFAVFGGLVVATVALPARLRGYSAALAVAAGTVVLGTLGWQLLPGDGKNPGYARLSTTAETLAASAPGAVLLDGYWGTYVFAALAPPGLLLPLAEDSLRMPAVEAQLASAESVLVGHRKLLRGPQGTEPRYLVAYGTLLERQEATFLDDSVDRFSLYRPRTVKDVPHTEEPGLLGLHLESAEVEVRLRADAAWVDTALAVELLCGGQEEGRTEGRALDAAGRRHSVEVVRAPGGVLLFLPPLGVEVKVLELSFERAPCLVRAARWFALPRGASGETPVVDAASFGEGRSP